MRRQSPLSSTPRAASATTHCHPAAPSSVRPRSRRPAALVLPTRTPPPPSSRTGAMPTGTVPAPRRAWRRSGAASGGHRGPFRGGGGGGARREDGVGSEAAHARARVGRRRGQCGLGRERGEGGREGSRLHVPCRCRPPAAVVPERSLLPPLATAPDDTQQLRGVELRVPPQLAAVPSTADTTARMCRRHASSSPPPVPAPPPTSTSLLRQRPALPQTARPRAASTARRLGELHLHLRCRLQLA